MSNIRSISWGQNSKFTIFDRFGVYLSSRRLKRELGNVPPPPERSLLDLGAGFNMKHSAELLPYFSEVTAVDISLNREIYPNIKKIEGLLSNVTVTLPDNRYNAVLLNSVLEHVKEPQELLNECYRILDNGGIFYVSVPTWKDKFFLEWTAFTLNIAHAKIEMNDHKMYYEKKDLWPMLVKAGFLPEKIKLSYYKFGLNLLGICRKENL